MDSELIKGTLSLLILTLLKRRAMYGYELASTVKQETNGAFAWKADSLYPSLHKLDKDGLVQAQWQGKPEGRQRKYYHLTETGEAVLADKKNRGKPFHWRSIRYWRNLMNDVDGFIHRVGVVSTNLSSFHPAFSTAQSSR